MAFKIVEKWQPVSAWGKSMESYLAQQGVHLKIEIDVPSPAVEFKPRPKKQKVIKIKPESNIMRCACGNILNFQNTCGVCRSCQAAKIVRVQCAREGCTRMLYTKNKYGLCFVHGQSLRKRARLAMKRAA